MALPLIQRGVKQGTTRARLRSTTPQELTISVHDEDYIGHARFGWELARRLQASGGVAAEAGASFKAHGALTIGEYQAVPTRRGLRC
jgi:hypothetical protein